jgi:hypothetical protein
MNHTLKGKKGKREKESKRERERKAKQDAANVRGLSPLPCGERVRVRGENY